MYGGSIYRTAILALRCILYRSAIHLSIVFLKDCYFYFFVVENNVRNENDVAKISTEVEETSMSGVFGEQMRKIFEIIWKKGLQE